MELRGQIEEFIYQNEANSYSIAVFSTDDLDVLTVVGYLPFINVGDNLKLEGKFITHQEYGRQFKIDTFEKIMPETLDALERYLANGSVKGVGPATAQKIIKEFGEETISIFKFEPEKLSKIKGISISKALEMAQSFNTTTAGVAYSCTTNKETGEWILIEEDSLNAAYTGKNKYGEYTRDTNVDG